MADKLEQDILTLGLLKTYYDLRKDGKILSTDKKLCEEMEYNESAFAQIKKGNRNAPASLIEAFTKKFKIKEAALIEAGKEYTKNVSHGTDKLLPFFDVDVSAGQVEMFDQREEATFHGVEPLFKDCDFGLRVFGHSMYPTYPNGIYVLCKRINNYEIIPYGECFLVITDEHRMIKRLMKSKYKGYVIATSDNEEQKNGGKVYDNFELDKKKIRKLYIIKGQVRKEQI